MMNGEIENQPGCIKCSVPSAAPSIPRSILILPVTDHRHKNSLRIEFVQQHNYDYHWNAEQDQMEGLITITYITRRRRFNG